MAHALEIDPGFLDHPMAYFAGRANFTPCQLETLLAHLTPFRAGPAS